MDIDKVTKILCSNCVYLFVLPLYFMSLLTAYLISNDLPIANVSSIIAYAILIITGTTLGIVFVFCNTFFKVLFATIIINSFVFSLIEDWSDLLPSFVQIRHMLVFIPILTFIFLYLIRENLGNFLVVFFAALFVGSIFTHRVPFVTTQNRDETLDINSITNKELPPYVHIILDEHVGIEGLKKLSANSGLVSDKITNNYINNGYRVYSKAYSRYLFTKFSFASFLNLDYQANIKEYIDEGNKHNLLKNNLLFQYLSNKGYLLHIVESTYLNLSESFKEHKIANKIIYKETGAITNIIYSSELVRVVLTEAGFGKLIRMMFDKIFINKGYIIPFKLPSSPLSTFRILNIINENIKEFNPGQAYFIHLLLPHRPYVFDNQCNYISDRGLLKENYIEQLQCTHKLLAKVLNKKGAEKAIIIIHSDHGSRLYENSNSVSDVEQDYTQGHSAFFAIKARGVQASFDQTELALDQILKMILKQENILPKSIDSTIKTNESGFYLSKDNNNTFEFKPQSVFDS